MSIIWNPRESLESLESHESLPNHHCTTEVYWCIVQQDVQDVLDVLDVLDVPGCQRKSEVHPGCLDVWMSWMF